MPPRQKSSHPLWRRWGPQLPLFSRAELARMCKKRTTPETTGQDGSGMALTGLDTKWIFGAMGDSPSRILLKPQPEGGVSENLELFH